MPRLSSQTLRRSLVGILALSACATVPNGALRRERTMAERYQALRDSIALAISVRAESEARSPRIHLVVPPTSWASTRWLEPSFSVSDDAYALVVAVDLDRRVRVLYPESPGQSGFAPRSTSKRLNRFFVGFGGTRAGAYGYRDATSRVSPFGGEGVLLAVASDRPLQMERLATADGAWDEEALGELVFEESLTGAAEAIGRAVVSTGQDFDTDYATFDGRRMLGSYRAFASSGSGECASGYGYGYGYAGLSDGMYGPGDARGASTTFVGFHQMGGLTFARYAWSLGSCGQPVYYDVPVRSAPALPRDTTQHDSSAASPRPRYRFPGAPRFPSVSDDSGSFPGRLRGAGVEEERRAQAPSQPVERDRTVERRETQRAEPVRSEPVRSEPVRSEPVRSEPVRSEPVRSEPVRSEPVRSEPVRTVHTRPEPR